MTCLRILVSVLAIVALAQAKPSPQSDDLGVTEVLGQGAGIGATLFSGALTTTREIGEQVRDVASSAWTAATQALLGLNTAVRESTVGALEGVQETVGSTGQFIGSSIRSGGRFAGDALTNGFNTAREASDSTGQFVAGLSRSAIQSGISTAESAGNLAQGAVETVGDFANSANEVTRSVVVGGLERITNQ